MKNRLLYISKNIKFILPALVLALLIFGSLVIYNAPVYSVKPTGDKTVNKSEKKNSEGFIIEKSIDSKLPSEKVSDSDNTDTKGIESQGNLQTANRVKALTKAQEIKNSEINESTEAADITENEVAPDSAHDKKGDKGNDLSNKTEVNSTSSSKTKINSNSKTPSKVNSNTEVKPSQKSDDKIKENKNSKKSKDTTPVAKLVENTRSEGTKSVSTDGTSTITDNSKANETKAESAKPYKDGVYNVVVTCFPDDDEMFEEYPFSLSVSIKNGKIDGISNMVDMNGDGKNDAYIARAANGTSSIAGVVNQVLSSGSLDNIDTVSMATCSSQSILDGCKAALEKAKK